MRVTDEWTGNTYSALSIMLLHGKNYAFYWKNVFDVMCRISQ